MKLINSDTKQIAIIHVLLVLLVFPFLNEFYGWMDTNYFLAGSLLAALNFYALVIVLKRTLEKKSVALPLGVIVSKYAVLGMVLNYVSKLDRDILLSFVIGLSTLIPSIIIFSLFYFNKNKAIET